MTAKAPVCGTKRSERGVSRGRTVTEARCKKCKGKKVTKEKKRIEFHIDPGTEDGERIALKGEGDAAVSHRHAATFTPRRHDQRLHSSSLRS